MARFIDLRLNRGAGQATEESFWPSFTDIMMVIVMIFLIATSVLIVRNWELLREITETSEEKRIAAELAYSKSLENASLEEQLSQAQHLISMLRLEKLRLTELQEKMAQELDALQASARQLEANQEVLKEALSAATNRSEKLASQLQALQSEQAETQAELTTVKQQLDASESERKLAESALAQAKSELAESQTVIAQMDADKRAQEAVINTLKSESQLSQEALGQLRREFTDLSAKYEKLIRPARTAKGKYVVSLRYTLVNGEPIYELKKPEDLTFSRYSYTKLHALLNALKSSQKDKLYIKIIFPEDSGLTYNEAWVFTTDILNKYDYYYQ